MNYDIFFTTVNRHWCTEIFESSLDRRELRIENSKVFVVTLDLSERKWYIYTSVKRVSKRWIDLLLEVVELCKSLHLYPCNRKIVKIFSLFDNITRDFIDLSLN